MKSRTQKTVRAANRGGNAKCARPAGGPTKTCARMGGDWARNFSKSVVQVIEEMEHRCLLDGDEVRRLRKLVEEAAGTNAAEALARVGNLHRRLAAGLAELNLPENAAAGTPAKKIDALFELNRVIAGTETPAQCFERLLVNTRKVIPCEGATLYLCDRRSGRLNVAASIGPFIDLIDRIEFDQGIGFSGWVAKTQKPVLFGSLKKSQPTHSGVVKSFLSAPIVVAGETIGVMNLGHADENIFTKSDLRLLMLIAGQAGGMIQKALYMDEIRELSINDSLTGLYNRRHLLLRIEEEIARASRFLQEFSVVYVDIDDFKRYNDAFGIETGDRAIAELGVLLKTIVRSSDILARHGGEEFAILLPMTGRAEAQVLAERIQAGVEGHTFPRRKHLAVSCGIAGYPADASEPQELLNAADKALQETRRERRNRVVALSAMAA